MVQDGLRLGDEPDAVPRARRFVAEAVSRAGYAGLTADAELVVSELVTNAQFHASPPVVVQVFVGAGAVRIAVADGTRLSPVRGLAGSGAMTGRGIALVEAVSRQWGVEQIGGGKVVWAELVGDTAVDDVDARPDVDLEALLAGWGDDLQDEERFTVRLGDVPTDLLIGAKAHVDNIAREFHLALCGAASGRSAAVPGPLAELIETVVHRFTDARQAIKRQALAAVARGEARTELTLTLPASAAEAGEDYLSALDQADSYARASRLLTLETPPQHRVFRRWYVESLVGQLRAAATGVLVAPPQTFEQRLLDELEVVATAQRATDHAARLQTVTAALAGATTIDEVSAVVVTEGVAVLGASGGALLMPAPDGHLLVSAAIGYAEELVARLSAEDVHAELPAAFAVRNGAPVWLESRHARDAEFPELNRLEPDTLSLCALPLAVGDRVLGALRFSFSSPRLFDDAERRFALALAAQTAQALDRARALDEARKASEKLSFLADASAALFATLDYRKTLSNIAELVVPRLADWCAVELREDDGTVTPVAIAHVDPVKAKFVEELRRKYPPDPAAAFGVPQVLRTGIPELYAEVTPDRIAAGDDETERAQISRKLGFRSAVIVPLIGRSGTLGVLTMVHAESGRRFDAADLPFAQELAARAAVAVENAREHSQQTGRLASMTRIAETVQQAILPPVPERIGPAALAARYVSAAEDALVGGDLYEMVPRPGAVRLLIGDVRGKGLDAVRLATIVLGGFRGAAIECEDIATVARRMDLRIRPYLGDEDFVTALIAEIRDDGTCHIVNCGHPPALLFHGGTIEPVGQDHSLPVGLGAEPRLTTVQLDPGDRLLLYTDGLIEARGAEGDFIDLAEVALPLADGPLPAVLDEILAQLRATAGPELGDDLALLVAEYRPNPVPEAGCDAGYDLSSHARVTTIPTTPPSGTAA
jgi:serine phosphatase RsbU (regulator of sigma subunit)/anti-sigma regulatory factor (Ser/Thr protein kinase)